MALKFAKLTRPAIRALKMGQKIAEHGIVAECLADGDVRYSVNVMCDGQRIHRVIGRQSDRQQGEGGEDCDHGGAHQARCMVHGSVSPGTERGETGTG